MKKIRLFAMLVFILSVNMPLSYSFVEPIGSMEEATSKLLAQRERNSSLIFKIAGGKRRLRRKSFRGRRVRGKRIRGKRVRGKSFRERRVRGKKIRGKRVRGKRIRGRRVRGNSVSAKSRAIRSKFRRR